jgi:hypothetical protein
VSPKCEADGCAKQPMFGFPGGRRRRCKAHMLEGMVRVLAYGTYVLIGSAERRCSCARKM